MKLPHKIILASMLSMATLAAISAPKLGHAASSRDAWLVQAIYQYNHPLATTLPAEVATKMDKMAVSPFAFYRGTAHLFYRDLSTLPASAFENQASLHTFINGDMHLANMGGLRDADGNNVYDTNDFDEGYLGQYHWDVRRMAVSIVLGAQENALSSSAQQQLVKDFVAAYLAKIGDFRGNHSELDYRIESSNSSGSVQDWIKASSNAKRSELLSKYTVLQNGRRVLQSKGDMPAVSSSRYAQIVQAVADYSNTISSGKRYANSFYQVKDVRQKLGSGIGSLGRWRYYALLEGPSSSQDDDVIVQIKQQQTSVVANLVPGNLPTSAYANHEGARMVKAMKASLSNTDVLAGWCTLDGQAFSVREKSPYETDFDLPALSSQSKFSKVVQYAGKVLAKNHAISDSDYDANLIPWSIDKEIDQLANSSSSSRTAFSNEILNFAQAYAAQVKLDYQSFVRAKNGGTVLY